MAKEMRQGAAQGNVLRQWQVDGEVERISRSGSMDKASTRVERN